MYTNMNDKKHCALCSTIFLSGDTYYTKTTFKKKWIIFNKKHTLCLCQDCHNEQMCIYCKNVKQNNRCLDCDEYLDCDK